MDNQTLFDVKNAVEVMSKALKLFAEKITELMNWYHINQDTINEYLKAFGNLILWRNAVNRLSENQIVFTEQLSGDMIEKVNKSTNVDEVILEYYTENEEKCLRNQAFSPAMLVGKLSNSYRSFSILLSVKDSCSKH